MLNFASCPKELNTWVTLQVEEGRIKDAENGAEIAKTLEGFVTRKVIWASFYYASFLVLLPAF